MLCILLFVILIPTTTASTGMSRSQTATGFVKLQASGIWWPALITLQKGNDDDNDDDEHGDDDPLRVAGNVASEVVVAHLLGGEDRHTAALRAADQGTTWRLADGLPSSFSATAADPRPSQAIPAALQQRYDAAVAALEAAAATAADYGAKNVLTTYETETTTAAAAAAAAAVTATGAAAGRALGKRKGTEESPSASAFVLDVANAAAAADAAAAAGFPHPGPAAALCPLGQHPHQRVTKRAAAIPWDDYFMAVAFLSAMRSKDPSTQVHLTPPRGHASPVDPSPPPPSPHRWARAS